MNEWTTNDASLYEAPRTNRDPNHVARVFVEGLLGDGDDLADWVTPQSRDTWDDFVAARKTVRAIEGLGLSTGNTRAEGRRDVAYVAMPSGVHNARVVPGSTRLDADAITLVWDELADRWLVHSIGEPVPAEVLQRLSSRPAPERA